VNDYWLSLMLGIVEGVTEFIPVSSTAHLRITEALLHVSLADDYWKMYSIVIQLGAVLCLPIYFRHRIAGFLRTFPGGVRGDRTVLTHPLALVLAAFVVTAVPGFLLAKLIGKQLEDLVVMGSALVLGGVVMWIVDARNARAEAAGPAHATVVRTWSMDDMTLGQAAWIGACQLVSAVFPGTSRSMSTIAGAQLAGISRAAALEFSFFLSLPTMAAATGYDLLKVLLGAGAEPVGLARIDAHGWIVLGIGFGVSFAVAYLSVAWLMSWVRRHGFVSFAIYRLAVGGLLLLWLARLGS
jgi:undecaprenyl-diphosphatase